MSKLLTSVDPHILEAVLGGAAVTSRCATGTSSDQLLQQLNTLSTTIQNIGNTANKTGFSTTDVLMLGILMSQQRQVNVFVRRPFW
jgi:hypothetical protein